MNKKIVILIVIAVILLSIFIFTGFFVIQPIGAIPDGITIWYIRIGLDLPFISSADGILLSNGQSVSLLGRSMMMSSILEIIEDKIIVRLPYSDTFYGISTNGVRFEN